MCVYVRIPRRPKLLYYWDYYSTKLEYTWSKCEALWSEGYYQWRQYKVITEYTYHWERYDYYWVPETHRWNKYQIVLGGSGAEPGSYIEEVTDTYDGAYPSYGPDDSYSYFYEYIGSYEAYPEKGSYLGLIDGTSLGDYPADGIVDGDAWYVLSGHTENTSKGSLIAIVSDPNINAYPADGIHTDGYWYDRVGYSDGYYYQGSHIEYVKSTTASKYPNNGYNGSDGYWYEIIGSETIKDTNLGTVSSKDPWTYPENGIHSDGYWYVKKEQ